MPDDLRQQIEPLHKIVKALGWPLLCIDDVEAADVIGTLAEQASREGRFTLISTGDKDMAQLVNDHVMLINTMTDTLLDYDGVIDKYGVKPEQMIDLLSLMGDSSDNIPGLPKVGEKTALAMLLGMGSIDAMLDNPEAITELGFRGAKTMPEKLREHKDTLLMSRELATIKLDVPLDFKPDELTIAAADTASLIELYKQCEFRRWLGEVLEQGAASDQASAARADTPAADKASEISVSHEHYEVVTTQQQLSQWLRKIERAEIVAFDTETTSLNYMEAELV